MFCDWLPTDDCRVGLDAPTTDKWGLPVARVQVQHHAHDLKVARYLVDKGVEVMRQMGAHRSFGNSISTPTTNLIAGGLRFGHDARASALDSECRVHRIRRRSVEPDVVIVGVGSAGLGFALLLARSGLRIALVDKQSCEQMCTPAFDGRDIAF